MIRMEHLKKHDSGFTLMELLVSMTVFLVVLSISSGVFIQTLRTQRVITSFSETMNNASLVIERIAREARTGYNFSVTGSKLTFTNAQGQTILYKRKEKNVDGEIIGIITKEVAGSEVGPLTSERTNVSHLQFKLLGDNDFPPRVTISLSVVGEKEIGINIQTTVSSRIIPPE